VTHGDGAGDGRGQSGVGGEIEGAVAVAQEQGDILAALVGGDHIEFAVLVGVEDGQAHGRTVHGRTNGTRERNAACGGLVDQGRQRAGRSAIDDQDVFPVVPGEVLQGDAGGGGGERDGRLGGEVARVVVLENQDLGRIGAGGGHDVHLQAGDGGRADHAS